MTITRTPRRGRLAALLLGVSLSVTGVATLAPTAPAGAAPAARAAGAPVTNLAHLDFLLDRVTVPAVPGHTTYGLAGDAKLTMPWTYADARGGGTFERLGGGTKDPVTGYYDQGAFNSDDITRAAVVYLRDWRVNHRSSSRDTAYQLLRSVAYFQTATGPNAGRSVLWMQPDGTLNPSAKPVELPDPSDSGPSYWQARTLWALGEGYAAFRHSDPAFARFLQQRLRLSLDALDREVLNHYGHYVVADGVRLPGWLIIHGADVTAEAVLGLSAYVGAAPRDARARRDLTRFATGIARMSAGDARSWPYGAIVPSAETRSVWHAYASQGSAALARSAAVLHRPALLRPAVQEAASFDTTLLTSGGPDNGWVPTPTDRTQIAYGADSRVQSLLATADVARLPGVRSLAALSAAWFFGANRAGEPMYDPTTGVGYDGLQPDGTVNRNSGAESTIHALLTMIALDGHPAVRAQARGLASTPTTDGLTVVEGESATATTGTVVKLDPAWTGESGYGGGAYLNLTRGRSASFDLGLARGEQRVVEPVSWLAEQGRATSRWTQGRRDLGLLRHRVGAQGITAVPGALLPQDLRRTARGTTPVTVTVRRGTVALDALLVRPLVSRARFSGTAGTTELLRSAASGGVGARVGSAGQSATIRVYDRRGRLVSHRNVSGPATVRLAPEGFAIVTGRG